MRICLIIVLLLLVVNAILNLQKVLSKIKSWSTFGWYSKRIFCNIIIYLTKPWWEKETSFFLSIVADRDKVGGTFILIHLRSSWCDVVHNFVNTFSAHFCKFLFSYKYNQGRHNIEMFTFSTWNWRHTCIFFLESPYNYSAISRACFSMNLWCFISLYFWVVGITFLSSWVLSQNCFISRDNMDIIVCPMFYCQPRKILFRFAFYYNARINTLFIINEP